MKTAEGIITVAEYVEHSQPGVADVLERYVHRAKALAVPFRVWKSVMEEKPEKGGAVCV